jgi:hypothetical protein
MVVFVKKTPKPKTWYSNRVNVVSPPIRFKRATWSKNADDGAVSSFKLRCNPTNTDSLQYELKVRSFNTGSVEQYILWKKDLEKLIIGQNLEHAGDKFAMTRKVLEGDALAVFNQHAHAAVEESESSYIKCMEGLAKHVFPKNALSHQKAWLHRSEDVMKKPDVKVRTWISRLSEINIMLQEFPPKFSNEQMLDDAEFIEIIEFGIPDTWRAKMVDQNFISANHTLTEVIEFCEKEEITETMLSGRIPRNNSNQSQSTNKGTSHKSGTNTADEKANQSSNKTANAKIVSYANSNGADGCMVHIYAVDHTTHECRVLKKQVEKMKRSWSDNKEQNEPKKKFKSNNYNNQKSGNQKGNAGDLHALMEKAERIKESLEKALKQEETNCGKRKREENHVTFSKDDAIVEEETQEVNDDIYLSELDQLSLNDADLEADLNDLEELEPGEISE